MKAVTAKKLHQETESILNHLEIGESVIVTRNGRRIARLQPLAVGGSPSDWPEIMRDVWQAQKSIAPSKRTANPVLVERRRRRR